MRYISSLTQLDTRAAELMTASFKVVWALILWYSFFTDLPISSPSLRAAMDVGITLPLFSVVLTILALAHTYSALSNQWRYQTTGVAAAFWAIFSVINISGAGWPVSFAFFFICMLFNAWAHLRLYIIQNQGER